MSATVIALFAKKWGKVLLIIGIFAVVLPILPFNVSLPSFLYNFLTGNSLFDVLNLVGYIFPVEFMFECILLIFLTKYLHMIVNVLKNIVKIVGKILYND